MPDCVTLSLYYWLYYNNLLVWAIKRQVLSALILIYTRGFPAIFRPRKQKMKLQSVWSFPPLVSVIACFWPCWPSPVGIVFVSPNFAITTFSLPVSVAVSVSESHCGLDRLSPLHSSVGHGRWLRFRIIDANAKSLNGAVNYVLLCNKVNHKNAAIN